MEFVLNKLIFIQNLFNDEWSIDKGLMPFLSSFVSKDTQKRKKIFKKVASLFEDFFIFTKHFLHLLFAMFFIILLEFLTGIHI